MIDRLFDFDGPVARFIMTFAELFWLNVLALLCSLPIITFGPSMKALAYTCLKMDRREDGYITKTFFKSFRENFLQTAGIGLLAMVAIIFLVGGIYSLVLIGAGYPLIIKIAFGLSSLLVLFVLVWLFPVQARFTNRVKDTIKNAFWLSLMKAPKTLLMILMWLFIPACYMFISENFLPLIFMLGFAAPAYFNAKVYGSYFRQLEEEIRSRNSEHDSSGDNPEE